MVINRHSGIVVCSGIALYISSAAGHGVAVSYDGSVKAVVFGQRGQVTMLVGSNMNSLQCRFNSPDGPRIQIRFVCEKVICKMLVIHKGGLEETSMSKGV